MKKKAKEFELRNMNKIKETKNKSKMKELHYEKVQGYFKTLEVSQAKTLFRFRTKMAQFDGNFRGYGSVDLCPLCGDHSDLQQLCFVCPVVKEKVVISEEYGYIFGTKISINLATTINRIMKIRKNE